MPAKAKDELRDHAAWLYTAQRLSLTEIKSRINIPVKTLSIWKKGRKGETDWDTRRRLLLSTPTSIRETLLLELEKVAKGETSKVDADQLVKIASSMQKIDKQLSVQVITSCVMILEKWLAKEHPEEAVRSLPFHKKFILFLINSDGQV
jgi:transposase